MKPKIKNITYGLGFTVCEDKKNCYIELNKNLKKYPKLRKQILAHEMLHWNSRGWWDDFKIDFLDIMNIKKGMGMTKFMIKHPRSFLANSPVFFENGKIIPNYFMLGLWGFVSVSLITGGILII